jgi:hypothetical protein
MRWRQAEDSLEGRLACSIVVIQYEKCSAFHPRASARGPYSSSAPASPPRTARPGTSATKLQHLVPRSVGQLAAAGGDRVSVQSLAEGAPCRRRSGRRGSRACRFRVRPRTSTSRRYAASPGMLRSGLATAVVRTSFPQLLDDAGCCRSTSASTTKARFPQTSDPDPGH